MRTQRFRLAVPGLLLAVAAPLPAAGQDPPRQAPDWEMTTYRLALLWRGENRTPIGERGIQRLQEEHLAWVGRMLAEGKVIAAGPVNRAGELRSVIVLDAPTTAEALAILSEDSWIRSGRLRAEVHPWWTGGGILRKPETHLRLERCMIGLLRMPPGAPQYDQEQAGRIQAGHLDHLRGMFDSGDLVLAGPMQDDGALRGILVFRTLDLERLRRLVAEDPAVKAGLLGVELYPWNVPRGTLPPARQGELP